MKKINYDFLEAARKMPPLPHMAPGEEFNIKTSLVANWLAMQPEIMQKIFDMARNKNVIRYDPELKRWKGVDYDD